MKYIFENITYLVEKFEILRKNRPNVKRLTNPIMDIDERHEFTMDEKKDFGQNKITIDKIFFFFLTKNVYSSDAKEIRKVG